MMAGQGFRTVDVDNFRPCIYALSIREPGLSAVEYLTYTFPLSPASLRKEYVSYTAIYDTQGSTSEAGVARDYDEFGNTPPTFMLEGTTGWKRHATDGFLLTGIDSMRALENLLNQYAQLNRQVQIDGSNTPYTLEFYDYFREDFWQVTPQGPQGVMQSRDRPLLANYRFRFVSIQAVSAPIVGLLDAIANVLLTPYAAAVLNAGLNAGDFLNAYTPDGLS